MSDRSHSFIKRMTAVVCSLLLTAVPTPFSAEWLMSANEADTYAELYVSPDGDDSNAGTMDAPLQTLAGARDLVFKGGDGYLFNLLSWQFIFPAGAEERVRGDVDADGTFDVLDIVLFQKWLLAIPDTELADPEAGDLDENDALDIFDFGLMKRELMKLSE